VVIRRQLRRQHVLAFFQKLPCLVGSRLARHRTIGPVSWRHWGIRCG
jgi:hypothetical protein